MMKSFTLEDLLTHSFEEIEAEGRLYGLLASVKGVSPGKQAIKTIISYSKVLKIFESRFLGNINIIMN
ncbi:MAG: hypothetical protein KAT48_08185 [Bacteroidales bacterium]|nr:hypothetical protein [Bacteroidales bacterium]